MKIIKNLDNFTLDKKCRTFFTLNQKKDRDGKKKEKKKRIDSTHQNLFNDQIFQKKRVLFFLVLQNISIVELKKEKKK